jgi:hypothetical protein
MSAYLNKRNPPLTGSSRNDSERMWFLPNSDMKAHCVNLMRRNQLRLIQCRRRILRAVEDALIQTFGNCVCSDLIKAGRTLQKERRQIKGKPEAHFYGCLASVATFVRLLWYPKRPCCKIYVIPYHCYILTLVLLATDFGAVWKKWYKRNQSIRVDRIWQTCSVTAATKCLSTTAGAFNWITIHDKLKNRREIKHKTQMTTIRKTSPSIIHDCYSFPVVLLTEEHQSWSCIKKSCPNFKIMYQPIYIYTYYKTIPVSVNPPRFIQP